VDITSEKETPHGLPQDGQGRRSRGGHVWPPCLDGPDTFTDTMDEAGPLGRPGSASVFPPDRWSTRAESSGGRAMRRGEVGRTPCKCVTPFVDILREGLRGADILRVGVTGVIGAR
jgi:hypothetical protein